MIFFRKKRTSASHGEKEESDVTRKPENGVDQFAVAIQALSLEQSDEAWARQMQIELDEQLAKQIHDHYNRDRKHEKSLVRVNKQVESTCIGKAWKLVENILSISTGENKIHPIAVDDMVFIAERMFLAQLDFANKNKPTVVDLGYHYTKYENMNFIKTDGLLSRPERQARNISSSFNGASCGEGIYTGSDSISFQSYGDCGLIVARLKGIEGNLHQGSCQSDSSRYGTVLLLKRSQQCLPLFQFDKSLTKDPSTSSLVREVFKKCQQVVDKFFNDDVVIPPYDEAQAMGEVEQQHHPGHEIAPESPKRRPPMLQPVSSRTKRKISYQAPMQLDLRPKFSVFSILSESNRGNIDDIECAICLSLLATDSSPSEIMCLNLCHHMFHVNCAQRVIMETNKCPLCRCVLDEPKGTMPSGTMSVKFDPKLTCPGFPAGTIVIKYVITPGVQLSYHDNPGQKHGGADRTAYVPDTAEGRKLLVRLEYAFSRGLTFRVGTSLTTRMANSVTWASIHHKTQVSGDLHGFPDARFLSNCNSELDALGVPQGVL